MTAEIATVWRVEGDSVLHEGVDGGAAGICSFVRRARGAFGGAGRAVPDDISQHPDGAYTGGGGTGQAASIIVTPNRATARAAMVGGANFRW